MQVVRTLIVDDDYYAREAMHALLARDKRTRVWGDATDVAEALVALDAARMRREPAPDVVLLDVRLHDRELGGIEDLPRIREAAPEARVLVSSVSCDEETILAAIAAGGDGYVWKNESAERIADAVVRVAEGRFVLTQSVADRLVGSVVDLALSAPEVLPERRAFDVTESVRRTVYLYCVCGMSAREIADELQVSVNTVNSRIRTAYQVLGAGSRSEAFERLIAAEDAQ